jgi:hypothetical protein
MMADRRTLEDVLHSNYRGKKAKAAAAAGLHECPNCGRLCHAFEIVDVVDVAGIDTDMACTTCLIDAQRLETEIAERKARKVLPAWETPEGVELKAWRDRMLDRWRWTVAPDSPLSAECQTAWLAYLRGLHRMTVDAKAPTEFKERDQPVMFYAQEG